MKRRLRNVVTRLGMRLRCLLINRRPYTGWRVQRNGPNMNCRVVLYVTSSGGVGCVNSIALQIAGFRGPTEFAHPTRLSKAQRPELLLLRAVGMIGEREQNVQRVVKSQSNI